MSHTPIYRISKWADVFETAESRRHKTLHWISMPVGFTSAGYQSMLDEFEERAPAIYGAWCALVSVAASCAVRGMLCTSKGKPMKVSHIARITGFQSAVFEDLLSWAAAPDVAWLEEVSHADAMLAIRKEDEFDQEKQGKVNSPGAHPGDTQPATGLPDKTRQDLTQPYITQPHPTKQDQPDAVGQSADVVEFSSLDWGEVCRAAAKFDRAMLPRRLDAEFVWESAWISEAIMPGFLSEVASKIKSHEIRKPQSYVEKAIRTKCEEKGISLALLRTKVPTKPALAEQAS